MTYRLYTSEAERITGNVTISVTGCWEWNLHRSRNGYARLQVNRKLLYAHRFSYEQFVGPIPDGLQLDHLCRNRSCVNPAHLEPVTPLENTRRSPIGNGRKEVCPQGHPYDRDNTRYDSRGCRICRTCNIERSAAWREARRRSAPAARAAA